MFTTDLNEVVERSHQALADFLRGDPGPMKPLMSKHDDVTLANPFGPPVRGWPDVEQAMDRAASGYRECERAEFERISSLMSGNLAYMLELEHYRARVVGGADLMPITLRVTSVFRHEEDGWRIVHRHADPITTPRSHASVVSQGTTS
jgi:ketosteroid isomerase-like protein